jgi:UDP-N-acetylglucosamine 2-epimerase (non-hydrolysing)
MVVMKILSVVGARPNFVKIAPLMWEMQKWPELQPVLVHTGQHYDVRMSGQFFQELRIPPPDISLEVGSGSHAYQTAEVMKRIEPVLEEQRPDMVLVVGDVNSTLASALTAAKLRIAVAHVEAGLRSFDRAMPEEINRVMTDAISDYLFVTEESGRQNLLHEGVATEKIHFVGNVMIDSLEESRNLWQSSTIHRQLGLEGGEYGVITLHRPSNVDGTSKLSEVLGALAEIAQELPLIFPVHPRTRKQLETAHASVSFTALSIENPVSPKRGIHCIDPLGYLDFLALTAGARLIFTDSGGVQEEATVLRVPCLTLRENTERPVTVSHGTNRIVGSTPENILSAARAALENTGAVGAQPPLWDGHAAQRIVSVLRGGESL